MKKGRRAITAHRMGIRLWLGLLIGGALLFAAGVRAEGADLRVGLKPRLEAGEVARVEVTLDLRAPSLAAGEVLLQAPIVRAMAPTAIVDPQAVTARDAAGPLALTVDDDPPDPSQFRQDRRWRTERATMGDVQVRYAAVPRTITPQTRPGPLYDMRREGSGFYGAGAILLALPPEGWPRPVRLTWDFSDYPGGARGASSLGEGDIEATVPREGLANAILMAGPLDSQPRDGQGDFVGYWITPPVYDLAAVLQRLEPAYQAFARFFGDEATPFRVFMRTTPTFAGGGSGGYRSFIFGQVEGEDRDVDDLLNLLAHETLHNWLNGLGEETSQWWSEGATSYYTEVLSHRVGLTTVEQFGRGMNDFARLYYENPRSNLPNDEVTRLFFSDSDAQVVPYQRGPLYFAQLDAMIRRASKGMRRVDDLVTALIAARREGGSYSRDAWVDLVRRELGEAGVVNFEAMMAGRPLDLPADLLGPCFDRQATTYRRFQPGFRADDQGVVTRVTGASAAETAGLEAGDVLVDPQGWRDVEQQTPEPATLTVRRGNAVVSVSFMPWGPEREGYRWVRNATPEAQCGI